MRVLFWTLSPLLAWAQVGYGLFLGALRRLGARSPGPRPRRGPRGRA